MKLSALEQQIYAAAFAQRFETRQRAGVTDWARTGAKKLGVDVVKFWEDAITEASIEDAQSVVAAHRAARKRMK